MPAFHAGRPSVRSVPRLEQLEAREVPAVSLDVGFPTISIGDSVGVGGGDVAPPDTNGAAGPDHVLVVVNTSIAWYTKDGTRQNLQSLEDFFAPTNPIDSASGFAFDPKVLYDPYLNRFVVLTMSTDTTNYSSALIAVSRTSNPNDGWNFQKINTLLTVGGNTYWADYPGFALDDTAIYLTANMFATGSGGGINNQLWVMDKGLYTGGSSVVTVHDPFAGSGGLQSFTVQPASLQGQRPPGFNGTYLVSYARNSGFGGAPENDEARVIRVDNPLSPTPTFTLTRLSLGNIDDAAIPATQPVNQPDPTATLLDGGDTRVYNAVWRGNRLVFANAATPGSGPNAGQATVNLMTVDISGGNPSLFRQQYIGGEDLPGNPHTFYPSVAINSQNEIGVGFAASGSALLPGAYFTAVDLETGTVEPSEELVAGKALYESFANFAAGTVRYGDYTATVLDPDDFTFWTFNQFSEELSGNGSNWATFAGQYSTGGLSYATGAGAGGGPLVKVYRGRSGRPTTQFFAYDVGFTGGVRVATADMNGDGTSDIIVAPGAGGGPHVKVFDGKTLEVISSFFAFESEFRGGLFLAVRDMDGDRIPEVVVSADKGGGPRVTAFKPNIGSGAFGATTIADFFAYDPGFTGGVRIALGDVFTPGAADIIVAPGFGGGPHVKVFRGNSVRAGDFAPASEFFAGDMNNRSGLFVAAGDFTGDKLADIVVSAGAGTPAVRVYDGQTLGVLAQIAPTGGEAAGLVVDQTNIDQAVISRNYPLNLLPPAVRPDQLPVLNNGRSIRAENGYLYGMRVAAQDLNNDGIADLILGNGPGDLPTVTLLNGLTFGQLGRFQAYENFFYGGVFVGTTGDNLLPDDTDS